MLSLPKKIIQVLRDFEEVFSERVWEWAKVLLIGAILAPGERTVAAILRVMGCSDEKQFQNYHRVLNRAKWSSRELSRLLLVLLVRLFVPGGRIHMHLLGFDAKDLPGARREPSKQLGQVVGVQPVERAS